MKENVASKISKMSGTELLQLSDALSKFLNEGVNEHEMIDVLNDMKFSEIINVRNDLMNHFSISASEIVLSSGGEQQQAQSEGSKTFKIILTAADATKKSAAIKAVKELLGVGLAEAKTMIDKVAAGEEMLLKSGLKKEDVDAMTKTLTEAGVKSKADSE
jgi:large subunit ribosomal protein L7/L12